MGSGITENAVNVDSVFHNRFYTFMISILLIILFTYSTSLHIIYPFDLSYTEGVTVTSFICSVCLHVSLHIYSFCFLSVAAV